MSEKDFVESLDKVKEYIVQNYKDTHIQDLEVLIVWQVKCIQNRKAIVIVKNRNLGFIYDYLIECTYNGDKNEVYYDFYHKEYKHIEKF